MKLLTSLWNLISPDRSPEWEKTRDREFILALNKLKTLSVTDRGGMSIDPEELREQVVASREQLKHLVHKPGAPSRPFKAAADVQVKQEASPALEAPVSAMDCIELVAWRRLSNVAAVRYVCLESLTTKQYAVATADLFSEPLDSLFEGLAAKVNHRVASSITSGEFEWFDTPREAMDAYDANL